MYQATQLSTMVDEGASSASSSPSSAIQIEEAVNRFVEEAMPAIKHLLDIFWCHGVVTEPTLKVLVYNALGGYLVSLSNKYDGDFGTAHAASMLSVMNDRTVSDLIDQAMSRMVDEKISGMVR